MRTQLGHSGPALIIAYLLARCRLRVSGPALVGTLAATRARADGARMGAGRVGVVYNPTKFADPELLIKAVRRRADAADAVVSWYETTAEDPGGGQAQSALDAGCDLVIACGGDGTISACAATLAGTQTRFALVPTGTGNLLARNLDVPMELRDALDVAFADSVRHIDVLRSETRRFVVMAGLGLDAALISDTSDTLKSRIGWLAYLGGLGTAIRRTPRARFTVTIDDGAPVTRTGIGVIVGNVGNLQGGIALLTAASHDDGALDVIVFAPERARDWLILAARIALRRLHVSSHAAVHQGKRVVITTDRPVPIEYDGEFAGYTESLAVSVMPAALAVCSRPIPVQGGGYLRDSATRLLGRTRRTPNPVEYQPATRAGGHAL